MEPFRPQARYRALPQLRGRRLPQRLRPGRSLLPSRCRPSPNPLGRGEGEGGGIGMACAACSAFWMLSRPLLTARPFRAGTVSTFCRMSFLMSCPLSLRPAGARAREEDECSGSKRGSPSPHAAKMAGARLLPPCSAVHRRQPCFLYPSTEPKATHLGPATRP